MADPTPIRPDAQGQPIPSLSDIPGRLRHLADLLERGDYGVDSDGDPISVRTALVTTYTSSGQIITHAFGEAPTNKVQVVGILALAQRVFTNDEGDIARGGSLIEDLAPVVPIR
jgi:hypothetical protein